MIDNEHASGHFPGRCRRCWRPCFRRVPAGRVRCQECEYALAEHRDPLIRLTLLAEGTAPDVLSFLRTDLHPMVRLAATERLDRSRVVEPAG